MSYKFGLIGYPIQHSLSPWIHEQFMQKEGVDGSYSIIEIKPDNNFLKQVDQLKSQKLSGFNVTVPYKQKIMPFLDEVSEEAQGIGAVNTVLNDNGKWIGYNTDGIGYLRSLAGKFPKLLTEKDKRILLLGGGGAARGIYYALVNAGFYYVDIANRTEQSAKEIAALHTAAETNILTLQDAEQQIDAYDIIIQTTSVGMKPGQDSSIISLDKLKAGSIVSDIIYQPLETNLLKQAQKQGSSIHYGHTMLLYQAQYAFEIWTNKTVPIEDMDHQLQLILEGR